MDGEICNRIEEDVLRILGLTIAAESERDRIILTGRVHTPEERDAVEDLARELAGETGIDNSLEIETVMPDLIGPLESADSPGGSELPVSLEQLESFGGDIEPDFTDQPLLTDPMAAVGPNDNSEDPIQEGNEVYFPSTDPVIGIADDGGTEVVGGFSATSRVDAEPARSALDNRFGDEAIADAVRGALRRDSATTDLDIDVEVRQGIVRLRGEVTGIEDAEAAEAVAADIPGVVEVNEDLVVDQL